MGSRASTSKPFFEFQKRAAAAFEAMRSTLDGAILDTFQSIRISETGVDLEGEGLRGPASTWTYLINDDALGDELTRLTVGYGNTAFAAGAVLMTGPLLLAWSLYRYFKTRKDGPSEP